MAAARRQPRPAGHCCRPQVERCYDAFVQLPRQPGRPAAAAAGRRAHVLRHGARQGAWTPSTHLPDDDDDGFTLRAGDQPREPARRDHAAGAEPAVRPAAAGPRIAACRRAGRVSPARRCWCPAASSSSASTRSSEPHSLDNERPAHVVDVPAFRIGRVPVTNGEWQQFIDDGGYRQQRWWSDRGWAHRQQAGLTAPQFWNTGWRHPHPVRPRRGRSPPTNPCSTSPTSRPRRTRRGRARGCPPRWNGRRPCAWDPAAGTRRRFPWGASEPTEHLANLGGDALRPAPVGAYPAGASAYGAEQMLGDVWEWTSSPLRPWPGFTPMLYEQYSRAVLRAATTRCCAAARGRSRRASCGPASATGTIRSGGRSSPVSGWPGTSLMCRHLGWLGAPVRWRRWCSSRRTGSGAVVCAATAEARPDERRRLGRRLLRR